VITKEEFASQDLAGRREMVMSEIVLRLRGLG
jgi:hypothetical protein